MSPAVVRIVRVGMWLIAFALAVLVLASTGFTVALFLFLPAAAALAVMLVWLRHRSAARAAPPRLPVDEAPLRGLSNAQLSRAWKRSYAELAAARDAVTLARLCAVRRQQLDEIERRDPTGFGRWINSGYWVRGDSAPFLGT